MNKPTPPKHKEISSFTYFSAFLLFFVACYGLYYLWTNNKADVLYNERLSDYRRSVANNSIESQTYRSETINFIRSVDKNYPIDNNGNIDVVVTTSHRIIDSKGSVGSDYYYSFSINGNSTRNNTNASINLFKPIKLYTKIVESDPSISDVGTAEDSIPFQFSRLLEGIEINQDVLVMESGGTRNSGSYDLFRVTYIIKPKKKLTYTFDFLNTIFDTPVLYLGFGLFLTITLSVLHIKRKKTQLINANFDNQYKRELEQYESERDVFIQTIKGKSIRKLAGVPAGVSFTKDDLPYDSDNHSKYGSFTLYITPSGTCYHTDKTCPRSHNVIPINLVKASDRKPCNRCAKGYDGKLPSWYTTYIEYKKKIKHYEITDYFD